MWHFGQIAETMSRSREISSPQPTFAAGYVVPPVWFTFLKQPLAVVQAGRPNCARYTAEVGLGVRVVEGVDDGHGLTVPVAPVNAYALEGPRVITARPGERAQAREPPVTLNAKHWACPALGGAACGADRIEAGRGGRCEHRDAEAHGQQRNSGSREPADPIHERPLPIQSFEGGVSHTPGAAE